MNIVPVPVAQLLHHGILHGRAKMLPLTRTRGLYQVSHVTEAFSTTLHHNSHLPKKSVSQLQTFLNPAFSCCSHQLNKHQVRHIKVGHSEPIIESEKSHSWDGIYGDEIAELLVPRQGGGVILDLTFGSGKHTEKILNADPNVRVIAIDRDPKCEEDAARLREKFPKRLCFLNIKHSDAVEALYNMGVGAGALSGAVLDAGLSHAQLTRPGRGGFFNSTSEPLDLRMNSASRSEPSAKDILNHIDEDSLYQVIKIYGQNKKARMIAQAIVQARYDMQDIRTTGDLHQLIRILEGLDDGSSATCDEEDDDDDDDVNNNDEEEKLDAAIEEAAHDSTTMAGAFHARTASTFRALRILVNDEANELECAIRSVHRMLLPDAPFAVVTYNQIEDTIVKRHFTGVDVDANVSTIGRPQHHRARLLGMTPEIHCKPWEPLSKHVPTYRMREKFPHLKFAKLRTATKVGSIAYQIVDN